MPQMDPKLDALLKANPDRTPSEMTQVLYGKKTGDIELKPAETIKQMLMRKLMGTKIGQSAAPGLNAMK